MTGPPPAGSLRPLALAYLRLHVADPPAVAGALTGQLRAYASREALTLADIYIDPFDPPAGSAERAGFCALMDALRRGDTHAVIIPSCEHLARRPSSYTARRTIIEVEGRRPTDRRTGRP